MYTLRQRLACCVYFVPSSSRIAFFYSFLFFSLLFSRVFSSSLFVFIVYSSSPKSRWDVSFDCTCLPYFDVYLHLISTFFSVTLCFFFPFFVNKIPDKIRLYRSGIWCRRVFSLFLSLSLPLVRVIVIEIVYLYVWTRVFERQKKKNRLYIYRPHVDYGDWILYSTCNLCQDWYLLRFKRCAFFKILFATNSLSYFIFCHFFRTSYDSLHQNGWLLIRNTRCFLMVIINLWFC